MARPAVSVRQVRLEDFPGVISLWDEQREQTSRIERTGPAPSHEEVTERLRTIAADPNSRALVATAGPELVGMTILRAAPATPLCDQLAVHVHYLYVRAPFRRRGAGTAFVAAAAAFAEEVGAEHVSASVPPQMRDTNRFYATLGFAPVVVRRSVPAAVLRRQLGATRLAGAAEHVLAQRRSMRRLRAAVNVSDLTTRAAARISR